MENPSILKSGDSHNTDFTQTPKVSQQSDKKAREQALLAWVNEATAVHADKLAMVSGDASFRRYFRCHHDGNDYIAVDAPPDRENNPAFLNVATRYRNAGVKVPAIVARDIDNGFWLLEDFGNVLLSDCFERSDIASLYRSALSQLHAIQAVDSGIPDFDDALLDSEFHLFNHWLLKVHLGLTLSEVEQQTLLAAQDAIRKVFKAQPQVGVHRDFHSRNLMVLNDKTIGVIDFQDAVTGPITYDVVSLLRDCYVVWPDEFVEQLLQAWCDELKYDYDYDTLKYWFDFVGMQRHIKASGIFCRLCHRDGKQSYLSDVPRTLEYIVNIALGYDQTRDFGLLVKDKILPAILAKNNSMMRTPVS